MRQADYGPPLDNWTDVANGWAVIFREGVTAEKCALAMIWMKVCRELNRAKRDNATDIAGYAQVLALINEARGSY